MTTEIGLKEDHIQHCPSPNFDERTAPVDMLVLHYTGMQSGQAAIERLCDPKAKVSAHYVVEEDGKIHRLVAEEMRAWHAGVSWWQGQEGVNNTSIGIEIVNFGHEWGYQPFPMKQVQSVVALSRAIVSRWDILPTRVVGHSDVAPERKEDPGELFPWQTLAEEGLSIGQYTEKNTAKELLSYQACLQALQEIGYRVPEHQHAASVLAFQRRFCPQALGQGLNPLTKAAIAWVHQQFTNP